MSASTPQTESAANSGLLLAATQPPITCWQFSHVVVAAMFCLAMGRITRSKRKAPDGARRIFRPRVFLFLRQSSITKRLFLSPDNNE